MLTANKPDIHAALSEDDLNDPDLPKDRCRVLAKLRKSLMGPV